MENENRKGILRLGKTEQNEIEQRQKKKSKGKSYKRSICDTCNQILEHCSTDGKVKTMKVERKSREVTYNENRKDNEIEHGGLSWDKNKKR